MYQVSCRSALIFGFLSRRQKEQTGLGN